MKLNSIFPRLFLAAFVAFLSVTPLAFGQQAKPPEASSSDVSESSQDIFKSLDYPELQVVPRASERIAMEAEKEKDLPFLTNWSILVGSAATLNAGLMLKGSYRTDMDLTAKDKQEADDTATVAQLVGASGVLLAIGLPLFSSYGDQLGKIRAIKGTDKKAQLLRERMAEEVLERQARMMNVVRWASVGANFIASSALTGRADATKAKFAHIAVGLSLLPIFFPPPQIEVYRKQMEYKRKIYTPIASLDVFRSETSFQESSWSPGITLSWAL